jgi:hypothetical protein
VVAALVIAFLGQKSLKMAKKGNSIKEEVNMGLNLMADDTPHVNFEDYNYKIGIGAYGSNWTAGCRDDGACGLKEKRYSIDMQEIS